MASPTASLPIRPSIYEKLHEDETRGEDKEIPIKLSIAGAVLSMPSTGQWELDHSSLQTYIDQSNVLSKRVEQLEKENTLLKEKCLKMTEESNMEKFKCQLLVEMLALSSLDEEKSKLEMEKEKAKAMSIKDDMISLMEEARKEGIDVRNFSNSLAVDRSKSIRGV